MAWISTETGVHVLLVLEVAAEVTLLLMMTSVRREVSAAEKRAVKRAEIFAAEVAEIKATVLQHARSEAEAAIAAARAELDAQAAQIQEQARAVEMARRGARGNEAREAKADQRAITESAITAQLGGEVVAIIRDNFPDVWENALAHPRVAGAILAPVVRVINGGRAAIANAVNHGGGGHVPYQ